jgi:hypothetical protein
MLTQWRSAWRWWRGLSNNPIYLRERGDWGDPNPYFQTARRYSPFIVSGALIVGACGSISNATLRSGDWTFMIGGLVCLSGIGLTVLTLIGSVLAPTLTIPAISREVSQGTWDVLRVIPQSAESLIFAKFFGGLARLKLVWRLMLFFGLIQTAATGLSYVADGIRSDDNPILIIIIPLIMMSLIFSRPWLEVLFAALTGLLIATQTTEMTRAIAATYTVIFVLRIVSSTLLWIFVFNAGLLSYRTVLVASYLMPVLTYGLVNALLIRAIRRRADTIGLFAPA